MALPPLLGSLQGRVALAGVLLAALALGLHALGGPLGLDAGGRWALSLAGTAAAALWLARWLTRPLRRLTQALDTLLQCWREGDYATHLSREAELHELRALARAHAELADAIRGERQHLAQREWLLDTVVQHTPIALLLLDAADGVLVANLAARSLLSQGRSLQGCTLAQALAEAPAALAVALSQRQEGLVSVPDQGSETQWLISQRRLTLQGQPLRLLLLRPLTRELARQEVAAWKRVLRVLSHELNNSLGPMASLAHSGAALGRRAQQPELAEVFERIGQRASHLNRFLAGYAQFAKLPAPQRQALDWARWTERLATQHALRLDGPLPAAPAWADPAQLEQAVLNLLKNAAESGGPVEEIRLSVRLQATPQGEQWQLSVADRGAGVSDAVLAQAVLPFYSTKRGGSGIGLALAREIAEAHGGQLELRRRAGGGVRVTLSWPALPPGPPGPGA